MKKEKFEKTVDYKNIFEIVSLIPKGRVTSYGAIAKALNLSSARIVGHAMRYADASLPVHRVVNSQGILSGDTGTRKNALENEAILVINNKIVDFKTKFWDPMFEIN